MHADSIKVNVITLVEPSKGTSRESDDGVRPSNGRFAVTTALLFHPEFQKMRTVWGILSRSFEATHSLSPTHKSAANHNSIANHRNDLCYG